MSVLTPARFIGVNHRTGPDLGQYARHLGLALLSGAMHCIDDSALADVQPMDDAQILPDDANGQPSLFPERGNQADQIDAEALLAHHHAVQLGWGQTATPTPGADPGHIDMLGNFHRNLGQVNDFPGAVGPTAGQLGSAVGNFHRNLGQVNDFPGAVGPTAGQLGSAVGTVVHGVLHPLGGRHATAGKAVASLLAGPLLRWGLPGRFRLEAGHSGRAARFRLAFQFGNPPLQPLNHRL